MRVAPLALAVCITAAVLGSAGCSKTTTHFNYRAIRVIKVRGTIHWEGTIRDGIAVRAVPEPEMRYSRGGTVCVKSGESPGPYELPPLALEREVTLTTVTRRYGIPRSRQVQKEIDSTQCYVISMEPPWGWEVTPAEYRVSKDTTNADFTLRKTASP